ncbi:hypothetical protein SNE40_011381 [Patella caerulea]|uniref:Uncharacterized protein n=1 Tax=Patella caerulea TaxID=87958 RepID=A0AAN8JMK2_PATCE
MESISRLNVTLSETEYRFRRACEQVILLNNNLQVRYDRARREGQRSLRYDIRLRISVAEGVRNSYYQCAHQKTEEVLSLRNKIRNMARVKILHRPFQNGSFHGQLNQEKIILSYS